MGGFTEDRLTNIRESANERNTLLDRVMVELVDEVRELRRVLAIAEDGGPS